MQVRPVIVAALLAATAAGSMAQEIDRNETLQGRSLAAAQPAPAGRTPESVRAETRNLHAQGLLARVGERADAIVVPVVPVTSSAAGLTRAEVKAELAQWRSTHPLVAGERG